MATKQQVKEVLETSEVKKEIKEAPKKRAPRKSSTKKVVEKVEEAEVKTEEPAEVVNDVKVEESTEPIETTTSEVSNVSSQQEDIKDEDPKPSKAKKSEIKETNVYKVIAPNGTYIYQGPGVAYDRIKTTKFGANLVITEKQGNWGKLSNNLWINLSPNLVENI